MGDGRPARAFPQPTSVTCIQSHNTVQTAQYICCAVWLLASLLLPAPCWRKRLHPPARCQLRHLLSRSWLRLSLTIRKRHTSSKDIRTPTDLKTMEPAATRSALESRCRVKRASRPGDNLWLGITPPTSALRSPTSVCTKLMARS